MSLFAPTTETAYFLPQRSIGPFRAKVTIEESAEDKLQITQHPVQDGATITDHAFKLPATLSVKAMFDEESMPLPELYQQLLDFQESREPFDVVTGKRTYTNMLVEGLAVTEDITTRTVLAVNFSLQQIIIVSVSSVSVPPRSRQAQPDRTPKVEEAGQKKTIQSNEFAGPPEQTTSKLYDMFGY